MKICRNTNPQGKKGLQALSSSSAERPMASGLERGSRSANRLNHADMSLDPPEEAAIIPDFSQLWVQNKPFFSLRGKFDIAANTCRADRLGGRLVLAHGGLQGRSLEHRWGHPAYESQTWVMIQNCASVTHLSRRGCGLPLELRLWSSSWDGRKPEGQGGLEGGPTSAAALTAGVAGGSKMPNASCHSLLNSSLEPKSGLRRSLRNAMSLRSESSSSGFCASSEEKEGSPERRPPPAGHRVQLHQIERPKC